MVLEVGFRFWLVAGVGGGISDVEMLMSVSVSVSRLTQSRIGWQTATEWRKLGDVRASVVERVPPMWEPRRDILGTVALVAKVRRMWLNAMAVS